MDCRFYIECVLCTRGNSMECVNSAVDGKLEAILPELGSKVRTTRLQMLATAPAPDVSCSRPVYRRFGYDYWWQLPDKSIAMGGFRDVNKDGEWTHDCVPSDKIQGALEKYVREQLPHENGIGTKAPITHRWAGLVAYTENGDPIFEEVRPGVLAIGAYNGTGNVVGSIYGKKAAKWAVD